MCRRRNLRQYPSRYNSWWEVISSRSHDAAEALAHLGRRREIVLWSHPNPGGRTVHRTKRPCLLNIREPPACSRTVRSEAVAPNGVGVNCHLCSTEPIGGTYPNRISEGPGQGARTERGQADSSEMSDYSCLLYEIIIGVSATI